MKKIVVFLLLCVVFSFAEDLADTIPPAESEINSYEISENAEELEEIETEIEVMEVVEEIDENRPTTLTISTTPDNASILINRRRVGNSPFTLADISPEKHNIMILKDGFELFDTTITIKSGVSNTLSVALISESTGKAAVEAVVSDSAEEISEADADTTAVVSEEDTAAKKKKMDRIGIIVFLSIMFTLIFMQEYNRR